LKTAKSEPVSLSFGSSDRRNELEGFIDSKTSYLRKRMILLLDKHNNVNHRSCCIMIVAKLDVYLQGLIFMRDDLVDCCFYSIFLDPAALKMSTL
jgi:hypothetical protein